MASKPREKREEFKPIKVADVNVAIVRTTRHECGGSTSGKIYWVPIKEYQLKFSGNEKHFEHVGNAIVAQLDEEGYDADSQFQDASYKLLTFCRKTGVPGGLQSIDQEAVDRRKSSKELGSVAIKAAIASASLMLPDADYIEHAIQTGKGRQTHARDNAEMTGKIALAKRMLGDKTELSDALRQAFETAGDGIYIGGRVNFEMDSKIGQNFLDTLADTLIANAAEKAPSGYKSKHK